MKTIFPRLLQIGFALLFPGVLAYANQSAFCNYDTAGFIPDRFEIFDDGTVRDKYTNLIWQRCSFGEVWDASLGACTGLAIGTDWRDILRRIETYNTEQYVQGKKDDWRLPNIKELSSMITLECTVTAIDKTAFPRPRSVYWTSTPSTEVQSVKEYDQNNILTGIIEHNMIWTIQILSGREVKAIWSAKNTYARLVRGQSVAE